MTSSDKTRQKLVEFMRTTKANSGMKNEDVDTKQTIAPQDDKPIIKKKKNTATKKVVRDSHELSVDPYQAVRRVWPD